MDANWYYTKDYDFQTCLAMVQILKTKTVKALGESQHILNKQSLKTLLNN